jgi:predicted RNA methylase
MLEILALAAILILLIPLSMLWPPDSPWAPIWKTSDKLAIKMAELAKVKSSDIIYDLGSGDAKPLIAIVKKYNCRAVGLEIDPLRFFISKIIVLLSGESRKIKLVRGDLFKKDISDASVVIAYLIPKALDKLLPKLKNELRKGTRIISKNYEIDLPLNRKDKKNGLFLYTI